MGPKSSDWGVVGIATFGISIGTYFANWTYCPTNAITTSTTKNTANQITVEYVEQSQCTNDTHTYVYLLHKYSTM